MLHGVCRIVIQDRPNAEPVICAMPPAKRRKRVYKVTNCPTLSVYDVLVWRGPLALKPADLQRSYSRRRAFVIIRQPCREWRVDVVAGRGWCATPTRRSFFVSVPAGGRFDVNKQHWFERGAQVRCTRFQIGPNRRCSERSRRSAGRHPHRGHRRLRVGPGPRLDRAAPVSTLQDAGLTTASATTVSATPRRSGTFGRGQTTRRSRRARQQPRQRWPA